MAMAEPSTLAAALIDHAHRTEGLCQRSRRVNPEGNGIPIANAGGAMRASVSATRAAIGQPTAAFSTGVTTIESTVISAATAISTLRSVESRSAAPRRFDQKLPRLLETSIAKTITIKA